MWWAVDLLASEYGWKMSYILDEIYFDDLYYLSQRINERRLSFWKMDLAISQNPHLKPEDQKKLWEALNPQKELQLNNAKFDEVGFELMKQKLSQSSRFVVK